ncbi:hypothetical protein H4R99_000601 [Coemansia sp. RSA 1722]|nr:hypothetical protein LPJ57_000290 [Coemansia sp. RSA 486]KAJ2238036.1 hypothetical protein IWW45_000376 [Coemansia sp. RSA 485]KAJ2603605.1 hypothetical protein GGF39_000098 [Coemansia sp. RSA 1721]KAJ2606206.1 hypothetical protein H4R99_000601 [Coemansia sp. RSA 1722]KAJ2639670.1 hypothetical protein GGF40_000636 [Coemansia sp. RSA 1286]
MASEVSTDGLRIGFIGLGTMGQAMALNLQAHRISTNNPPISVYNRSIAKTQLLKEKGATVYETPTKIAANSDVIFLSLFNGDSVKQVIAEILDSLTTTTEPSTQETPSLVISDLTTVHPSVSTWVMEQLEDRKKTLTRPVYFSQTPVWGAPPVAVSGKLVIVVSGEKRHLIRDIAVPAFARASIDCGPQVARAARFKILGNFMIASIIESLGEAMAVADQTDIGRELYLEFIKQVLPVPSYIGYASKMVDDNGEASKTQVGFTVPGGMKDIGYAIDVAKDAGMRLPIAELAYEHLQWVMDNGDPNWDWSSLAYALRKEAQK